jgi:serine/threonine-protein kinase RsbW
MAEVRRLTVRGRYDCIPGITSFVGEAASAAGLNDDEAFHCRMAVDEACTNIIEHAYGGEDWRYRGHMYHRSRYLFD